MRHVLFGLGAARAGGVRVARQGGAVAWTSQQSRRRRRMCREHGGDRLPSAGDLLDVFTKPGLLDPQRGRIMGRVTRTR